MISIKHYSHLENTPAIEIALRGQLECLEQGGAREVGLHWSYPAIVAFEPENGTPVGVIVWIDQKDQGRLWLQLGYVLPRFRGMGIYSRLWQELVSKARELKVEQIWSGTSVSNERMRAIARRQGRQEIGISLKYEVTD